MLTLSPTQPPEAPSELQISQDAARRMLAALHNTLRWHDQLRAGDLAKISAAIDAAEGRAP